MDDSNGRRYDLSPLGRPVRYCFGRDVPIGRPWMDLDVHSDKQPERRLVTYSDGALEWDNRRTSRRLATCACLFGCGHQSETLHDLLRVHALYCAKRRLECVLGCGTLMPMARVDEHERLCVRRWMTCSLGCGIRLAMRDVDAHTRACSHRTGACRLGCGLHLRACDAPRHESECTYRSAPR